MEHWVQQIVIFVVIVTVLRSLITRPHYQQYFQFLSGLILILLTVTPLLQLWTKGEGWTTRLEQSLLAVDREDLQQQLQITEGKEKEMVAERYKQQIADQIVQLGGKHGITVEGVKIECDENMALSRLEIHIDTVTGEDGTEREGTDGAVKPVLRKFREEMQKVYELQEGQVEIWI